VAFLAHQDIGIPYVVTVRDTDLNVFMKLVPFLRATGRQILDSASQITFLSHPYRQELSERWLEGNLKDTVMNKSSVVPNGLGGFWLDHVGDARAYPGSPLRFLLVGSIDGRKDPLGAIRRTTEEMAEMTDAAWNFSVMGQVPWALSPMAKWHARNIENRLASAPKVQLLPHGDADSVMRAMANADIFILLSHRESFGRVYLEAISQGLPVLYTKGQGFDGLFPDGEVGFPVDLKNKHGLGDAVTRILDDYVPMSDRCITRARDSGWSRVAKQYERVYLQALA